MASQFFSGVSAYILPAGIEKARIQIFKTKLIKFGGQIHEIFQNDTTHIVVDEKMEAERMCRIMKVDSPPPNVCIVKSAWLSASIRKKEKVSPEEYHLDLSVYRKRKLHDSDSDSDVSIKQKDVNVCDAKPIKMWHSYKKVNYSDDTVKKSIVNSDSDYEVSDDDSDFQPKPGTSDSSTNSTPNTSPSKVLLSKGNWICTQSSKNPLPNLNPLITEKLEEMVQKYKSTSDTWRAFGYQKAIQVLKKHPKPITTWEEARALPGIGTRLADKIWEIVESGELRKLNEFKCDDDIKVLELFTNVWGAGAHTARNWIQQGFQTLEDLKTKAKLTHQQKVGLNHYDDFLDRMPRQEAADIEKIVCEAAESLQDGVLAQACGSYRRGKVTCGDVDILVTHPDGKSHRGLFGKLIQKLKQQGFLTDDLVSAEDNGNQKKYLGVCKLPGENRRYRRIDIIVVPYDEYACALVYFTGSAHLNRSLRLLAKKMGMSLSEHSLNKGVIRKVRFAYVTVKVLKVNVCIRLTRCHLASGFQVRYRARRSYMLVPQYQRLRRSLCFFNLVFRTGPQKREITD